MRGSFTTLILTVALTCSSLLAIQRAVAAPRADRSDDTAFYQVPLMCPAARGLGCGSRAKPLLLALEKTAVVEQAWLDRTGQTLAVIWSRSSATAERAAALAVISDAHSVSMDELIGPDREVALRGFHAGEGWHRGADVDRLSEEEALVITDRLLARLVISAPTATDKTKSLRPVMTDSIRQLLVGPPRSQSEWADQLLTTAREHLNGAELNALRDAMAVGLRPVGDER